MAKGGSPTGDPFPTRQPLAEPPLPRPHPTMTVPVPPRLSNARKGLSVSPGFDFLDLGRHEEQVRELIVRLSDLRTSLDGAPAGEDAAQLREVLLLELDNTLESMRTSNEELRVASEELADRQLGEERERHLLRAVYGGLPLGVVLLDDDLRIRRINEQAAHDLGVSAHYVAGRPFTVFVALADRPKLRARFGAARRSGESVVFPSRLLRRGVERDSTLVLTSVSVTQEQDEVIVLVIMPPNARPELPAPEPAPEQVPTDLVAAVATQVDVTTNLAESLLEHPITEDGPLLDTAARFMAAGLADWVVVDLLPTAGSSGHGPAGEAASMVRTAVVGPAGESARRVVGAVAGARPERAPLVREALEQRRPGGQVMVEDQAAFGVDAAGTPLLARMEAHSVACFPLGDGDPLGVVTVARRVGSAQFDFTELGLLERLVRLIALALRQLRVNRRRLDQVRTLQVAVQPGTLPDFAGTELACAYQPPRSGEAVGRQFTDAFL